MNRSIGGVFSVELRAKKQRCSPLSCYYQECKVCFYMLTSPYFPTCFIAYGFPGSVLKIHTVTLWGKISAIMGLVVIKMLSRYCSESVFLHELLLSILFNTSAERVGISSP